MFKPVTFAVISTILVYISRASLRAPRSHGFYRLIAWECILALFLLNVGIWFDDPFSWHQLISWCLLMVSLVPLAFGVYALTSRGKPVEHREDDAQLLAFEKTTTLVTTGVYQYIRHPMYSSLLLLAWGLFFKDPDWIGVLLVLSTSVFLVATARADEQECIRFFGPAYEAYMKRSRRFIPFLF